MTHAKPQAVTFAWYRLLILAAACFLVSTPAAAYRFGTDETIHKIQDVTLKGPQEEKLFLGYMTRMRFFLAGVYAQDAGYILGVEGDAKRFFRLPEGEELKKFQRDGLLPDPLPPYSLSFWDYLFGYSLWIVLALMAGYFAWDRFRKQKTTTPESSSAGPPAPPATPTT